MGQLSKWLSDLHRANAVRNSKAGLKAEFQDDKGRWYSSFIDDADVPISRLSFAHTHLQYMAAGLSADLFHKVIDEVTVALAHSDIVKAGALISDMTDLNKKIVNLDAMINVVATYYVREDEDPVKISNTIHAEKCDFLKTETDEGRFFFQVPRTMQLLGGLTLSKAESDELWRDYQSKMALIMRRLSTQVSGQPTPV